MMTTIKVTKETQIRLNKWKYELGCGNVDELINKILRIIPASQLDSFKRNNRQNIQIKKEEEKNAEENSGVVQADQVCSDLPAEQSKEEGNNSPLLNS